MAGKGGMEDHFERMLGLGGGPVSALDRKAKASAPAFMPSAAFTGRRPGYVFKRGAQGVGYYEDFLEQRKVRAQGREQQQQQHSWLRGTEPS